MAVDEAVLLSALDGRSDPTIRFFQWEKPSITFGYMLDLNKELNIGLCRDRDVPFIRRITGGGVVFHGCDITFSIVFPKDLAPDTSSPLGSYRFINEIFLHVFGRLGFEASLLAQDNGRGKSRDDSRNVCFVEPTTYDVLYGSRKLVGNAQRRRKSWVLNHGSMLFNSEYQGMADLIAAENASKLFSENCVSLNEISPKIKRADVIEAFIAELSDGLGVTVNMGELSDNELTTADHLATGKYSTQDWNFRRRVP